VVCWVSASTLIEAVFCVSLISQVRPAAVRCATVLPPYE
jgi:hypothetical protein